MMRWLLLAVVSVALSIGQAQAQSYIRVTNCGDGAPPAGASQGYMDSKGNICTDASNGGGGAVTIADGADVTLGAKADAKSTATDTTPITLMSAAKQISASVQAMATSLASALTVAQPTAANLNATVVGTGTFAVQAQPTPVTSGGLSVKSMLVANNTTSVAVDASPGQAYGFEAFNNTAVIAYLKLYNAAQGSTTCGSGTPVYRGMIPASTSGAGYVSNIPSGIAFSTAITACITTGIADNDTGAPAASGYIVNVLFK